MTTKPCPFCGTKAVAIGSESRAVFVVCMQCNAHGPVVSMDFGDLTGGPVEVTVRAETASIAARRKWNNRGEPVVLGAPPPVRLVHDYKPHRAYPWFCYICGYAEHEGLQHPPQTFNRYSKGGPVGAEIVVETKAEE